MISIQDQRKINTEIAKLDVFGKDSHHSEMTYIDMSIIGLWFVLVVVMAYLFIKKK